jgi:hypothetical protein
LLAHLASLRCPATHRDSRRVLSQTSPREPAQGFRKQVKLRRRCYRTENKKPTERRIDGAGLLTPKWPDYLYFSRAVASGPRSSRSSSLPAYISRSLFCSGLIVLRRRHSATNCRLWETAKPNTGLGVRASRRCRPGALYSDLDAKGKRDDDKHDARCKHRIFDRFCGRIHGLPLISHAPRPSSTQVKS